MSGALVVFAKAPRPGAVKTRLVPPFDAAEAAALYACMLDDVLEASAELAARHALAPVLAVHPPDALDELARRAPPGFRVLAQHGPDLGARMDALCAELAAEGTAPLLLRGSDSPALSPALFGEALEALAGADLALSPDPDGGYGLVALRRAVPGLFAHEMSTASVLAETRARAEAAGLRTALLRPGFDLDVAADLDRLATARDAGPLSCPRTLAWLDRHAGWRRSVGRPPDRPG